MEYRDYLESIRTLNKWAKAYYVDDNPVASDEEYDRYIIGGILEVLKRKKFPRKENLPSISSLTKGVGKGEG